MRPLKILYPLSFLYLLIFNISQKIKKSKQKKLPCRVISVGNITVGGTGKTPAVIYLAEAIKGFGKKVAVVSRGYKSRGAVAGGRAVSDGKKVFLGPKIAGDEPYLIAKSLDGVPVVVGKNRYRAGLFALEKFGTKVVILDDGFQHLNLCRDIDIVCINALNPFGNNMLLPSGYLREPVKNIVRASAFIITRCDKVKKEKISEIEDIIGKYNKTAEIFHASFGKKIFYKDGPAVDPLTLKNQNAVAVSGIAVPEDFESTLKELGVNLLVHRKFPDHYFFKDSDIKKFYADAAEFQAIVMTTSKDVVRLPEDFPCYILDIKLEIREEKKLKKFLEVRFAENSQSL